MYRRKTGGWSQHLDFMTLDILCLEVSLILGFAMHFGFHMLNKNRVFWSLCIAAGFIDLMIMVLMDSYHNVIRRDIFVELRMLAMQIMYLSIGMVIFIFMMNEENMDVFDLLMPSLPFYGLMCFNMRVMWREQLRHRLHMMNNTSMLILAKTDRLRDLITRMVNHNYGSYRFVGVALLDDVPNIPLAEECLSHIKYGDTEINDLHVVTTRDNLIQYLVSSWVDEIYLDTPTDQNLPVELINEIMGMGITVHVAINSMDQIEARNKNVEWLCGQVTFTTSLGYVSGRDLLLKRIMDIIGGLVGSAITVLLTLVLGPMIYFASPGPIFFKQQRIGENGRKFWMYKFRSMYLDAEKRKMEVAASTGQQDELMFKMEHDPRIIGQKQLPNGKWKKGIGGWIRDLSLDEFPQFFNVLKGDMSLVGTRPPTVDEWERYKPYHRGRMSTKPGITGLWQVSGRSKIRDFDKVVQLDREYIENWSLMLDWKIILRTFWAVFTRKGAM
ncbi:MAG: sugar transferase [Clostridia bacterium]|nr:sugar transferase [Clostridia bacterium]